MMKALSTLRSTGSNRKRSNQSVGDAIFESEGGKVVFILLGQTEEGRYLFIVLARRRSGHYRVVTAREMTDNERRRYRKKMRRAHG
jgi:uncharacterized DUF497 family protein